MFKDYIFQKLLLCLCILCGARWYHLKNPPCPIWMDGAAGPSGVDAAGWKRLCTSFGAHSADLCHAISSLAKTICTTYVDPNALEAFLADWTNVQMSDPLESVIITLKSVIHNSKKVLAQFIYCWHIQEGGPVVCQIHFIGFVNIWHCRWH